MCLTSPLARAGVTLEWAGPSQLVELLWLVSAQGGIGGERSAGKGSVELRYEQGLHWSAVGGGRLGRGCAGRSAQDQGMLLPNWVESVVQALVPAGVHVSWLEDKEGKCPPFLVPMEVSQGSLTFHHRL